MCPDRPRCEGTNQGNGRMKKIWIAAALLSCCLLSGCSPMVKEGAPRTEAVVGDSAHYPVTVETLNSHGEMREETFQKPPKRVVCIWQNSIENLMALGVGDRIVAAMGLPDGSYLRPEYRETYAKIPYTSMEHLDMETVMLQDPDLIVGWHRLSIRRRSAGRISGKAAVSGHT